MENRAGMSSLMLVGNTMLKTKLRFAWILSQSLISLWNDGIELLSHHLLQLCSIKNLLAHFQFLCYVSAYHCTSSFFNNFAWFGFFCIIGIKQVESNSNVRWRRGRGQVWNPALLGNSKKFIARLLAILWLKGHTVVVSWLALQLAMTDSPPLKITKG